MLEKNNKSVDLSHTSSYQWRALFTLLSRDDVSEIHVNDNNHVFYKRRGVIVPLKSVKMPGGEVKPLSWEDNNDFLNSAKDLENNMTHYGDAIDQSRFIYEGGLRLHRMDGTVIRARMHMIMPPVTESYSITIAKQSESLTTLDDLYDTGLMNQSMMEFIRMLIRRKKTVVVTGASGAGKTTLLTALAKEFAKDERIAVCEDSPELSLDPETDVTYMRSCPFTPGKPASDEASLSWVVAQANRMRPNRVIIGETRGPEFADFVTAANSGYEGSLTTLHAESPDRALQKMAGFIKKSAGAGTTPMAVINTDIAQSIDYIIQIKLVGAHHEKHRISEICEVSNTIHADEGSTIATNPIWQYADEDDDFKRSGYPEDDEIREAMIKLQRTEANRY